MLVLSEFSYACSGILAFPGIKRSLTQPVLAHNLRYRLAAGLLLQNGHNSGLTESSLFICQSSGSERYILLYSLLALDSGKCTGVVKRTA